MPITFWTFVIGTLALAGIFPFAGFWSKDEILHHALGTHTLAYAMGAVAAFLTAFYMTRQVALTFFGDEPRDHHIHAHESPPVMWVPLVILAVFAAVLGLAVGFPRELLGQEPGHLFGQFLDPVEKVISADPWFMGLSMLIALAGMGLGWFVYVRRPLQAGEPDPLSRWLGPVYTVLQRKYYFDELYHATFVRGTLLATVALAWVDKNIIDWLVNAAGRATDAASRGLRFVDINIVDGFVNAIGALTTYTGDVLRVLQTGKVQNYILIALTGLLVLTGYFIYVLYR
jgi:NADH-quinone oxidoreductase subunit L